MGSAFSRYFLIERVFHEFEDQNCLYTLGVICSFKGIKSAHSFRSFGGPVILACFALFHRTNDNLDRAETGMSYYAFMYTSDVELCILFLLSVVLLPMLLYTLLPLLVVVALPAVLTSYLPLALVVVVARAGVIALRVLMPLSRYLPPIGSTVVLVLIPIANLRHGN